MIARLSVSLLFQLGAIALGWSFFVAGVGQGAQYLLLGWWGSLLGLLMLGMALMVPLAGLLFGSLVLLLLRMPRDRVPGSEALVGSTFLGGLLFALAYLATATAMWQVQPARASENASYGADFLVVGTCLALGFGFLASFVGVAVLARRMPTFER